MTLGAMKQKNKHQTFDAEEEQALKESTPGKKKSASALVEMKLP